MSKKIPYPVLREKVLNLNLDDSNNCIIERCGVIVNEKLFVESHIKMIDSYPKKDNMTETEKNIRVRLVQPFYDRLLAYFLVKSVLC